MPIVVENITLAEAGAATCTASVSPICIAVALGLTGTTPGNAFNVSRFMPKVVAAAPTVMLVVAVVPAAVALTVTAPAVAPATVTTSWPLASVVPEAGVSVTVPLPDWVSVTAVPEIGLPPLSFAVMVNVVGGVPLEDKEELKACIATVEPTTWTGYKAVALPDVAVTVAVRFVWFAAPYPEEKVAVAVPEALVTRYEELS